MRVTVVHNYILKYVNVYMFFIITRISSPVHDLHM